MGIVLPTGCVKMCGACTPTTNEIQAGLILSQNLLTEPNVASHCRASALTIRYRNSRPSGAKSSYGT